MPRRGWPEVIGRKPRKGCLKLPRRGWLPVSKAPGGLAEAGGFYPKKGASIRGKRL